MNLLRFRGGGLCVWSLIALLISQAGSLTDTDVDTILSNAIKLTAQKDFSKAMTLFEKVLWCNAYLERSELTNAAIMWLKCYRSVGWAALPVKVELNGNAQTITPFPEAARARLLLRIAALLFHYHYYQESAQIAEAVSKFDGAEVEYRGRAAGLIAWCMHKMGKNDEAKDIVHKVIKQHGKSKFVVNSMRRLKDAIASKTPSLEPIYKLAKEDDFVLPPHELCGMLKSLMFDADIGMRSFAIPHLVYMLLLTESERRHSNYLKPVVLTGLGKKAWQEFLDWYRSDGPCSLAGEAALKVAHEFLTFDHPESGYDSERVLRLLLQDRSAYPREFIGRVMLHLAYAFDAQGKHEMAEAQMERCLKEYGDIQRVREVALTDLGFYRARHDVEGGLGCIRKALKDGIQHAQTHAVALYRVCFYLYQLGKYQDAISAADEAIKYASSQLEKTGDKSYQTILRDAARVKVYALRKIGKAEEAESLEEMYDIDP